MSIDADYLDPCLYNGRGKGGYDEAGSRELKFAYRNGVWRFQGVFHAT